MARRKSKTKYKGYTYDIQKSGTMYYVSIECGDRVVNTFGDDGFDTLSYARMQAKYWIDSRVEDI